jgi:hypothetical protein
MTAPGASQQIFKVRVVDPDIWAQFKKGQDAERTRAMDTATGIYGRAAANIVMRKMVSWLSRGGPYNIGASGAASENLEMTEEKQGADGYRRFIISEGTKTVANALIRHGWKGPTKVPSFDKFIPILQEWAAMKGFTVTSNEEDTKRIRLIHSTSRKGNPYVRAWRGTRTSTEKAFARIAYALAKKGTFRRGSNWYNRSPYPKRQGRFDYVAWMMQTKYWKKPLEDAGNGVLEFIVDRILSGRKKGWTVQAIGGLRQMGYY